MKTYSVPAAEPSHKKDAGKNYMDCYLALQIYQLTKAEREGKRPRLPLKDVRKKATVSNPQFSLMKYLKQHFIFEMPSFRKALQKVNGFIH